MKKICLRRKTCIQGFETFSDCIGPDCPLHISGEDKRQYCLDILKMDLEISNLVYGKEDKKEPEEKQTIELKFVRCKRCGCGYGHP